MTLLPVAILSLALLANPQGQPPDRRAEAERLAQSGQHARALQEFQALVSANPDDIEARLWIARLHVLMGHPERAADVYQSIVATNPQNVQALVGLGSTLTRLGRFAEAGDALNRAEAIAADQPSVLAAQGSLHRKAGHITLALAYYQRALALDQNNKDTRDEYDALRAARAHRIEGTYYFEHYNVDVDDTHAGLIEANFRVSDSVRFSATGEHMRKFGLDENRGGAGIEWAPRHDLSLSAKGIFGSNTIVLPDADASLDAEFRGRRVALLGSVRYLHFSSSSSVIVSPGFACFPTDRLGLTVRYYRSHTDFGDLGQSRADDGFSADASFRAGRHVWLNAGYAHGYESLRLITFERLDQVGADIGSAGIRADLAAMTSVHATWEQQWRDGGTRVGTLFLTLVQRF